MPSYDDLPATALRGKLLYIEDHPVNMMLVEELLTRYPGIALSKATSGREGIERVRADQPDLVLLDMNLPDIGGLEVVRALNELLATGHPRLVLLTADAVTMDVLKAMSLGAHDYWPKPVDAARLDAMLRQTFGPRA